jgi:hypothetical protein
MSQTIAIILRLREDEVDQFESLFRAHILPMWKQFQAAGKFLGASLSPVVDGSGAALNLAFSLIGVYCNIGKKCESW